MATIPVSTSLKWDILVTKSQSLNRDLHREKNGFGCRDRPHLSLANGTLFSSTPFSLIEQARTVVD